MKFHLWDTEAGSLIGQYTEERTALETVKSLVDRYGPTYADELSLGRVRDDGTILAPLSGSELVACLVKESNPEPKPADDRRGRVIASASKKLTSGYVWAMRTATRGEAYPKAANRGDAYPKAPKRDRDSRAKRD